MGKTERTDRKKEKEKENEAGNKRTEGIPGSSTDMIHPKNRKDKEKEKDGAKKIKGTLQHKTMVSGQHQGNRGGDKTG